MGLFAKKQTPDVPRRRQSESGETRRPADTTGGQYMFQRNRTLTGSTSNDVRSAQRTTDDLRSPRTQAHHLALQRRKISTVLIVVLAGSGLLFWLLLQFTARVSIVVEDTALSRPIDSSIYEKAINDYLGINPVMRLRFAVDVAGLSSYVSSQLPEVESVDAVNLASIGETAVSVTLRHPVAGWTIQNRQYYVDAQGVAFERNYFANPTVQIVDDSGAALQQGTTVASNRFLGFVGRVVALSRASGYTVSQAILPAGTTRQLEVRIDGVGPRVKLSIDRPAGEQVEDMVRALGYVSSQGIAAQYIDVRVSGKAFYQ
jgi:hypothetical protein